MRFSILPVTLFILVTLFIMPLHVYAEESEIYTIQTATYSSLEGAMKHYDSVILGLIGLNGSTFDYLRIEKIGRFYAVRVGKFINYIRAQEFLHATRSQLTGAIILKARTIDEKKLIKLYGEDPVVEATITAEEELLKQVADTAIEPEVSAPEEKAVKYPDKKPVAEELQMTAKSEPEYDQGVLSNIRGKFYISDYYSTDSGDYNFHVLTTRLNIYKREREIPGYYFEFDGKARKKILNGDLRGNVPDYSVDEAWLGYKFHDRQLRAIAGRQYIQELYNTDIDGLNVKYSFKNGLGIGVFGGLAPDKFDDSFNTDYRSVGLYGFLNKKDHKINIGYEYLTYKGEPDREYFSLRANSRFNKKIRLNAITAISKNQITSNFEMENANANLTYSYTKKLRFNVFASYYRSIKYYESSKYYFEFSDTDDNFLLDNNSQTRAGIRADYKIAKGLKVYGSTAYQHRKLDDEDSTRFTGGIRKYDLYGFDLSGRYTYIDNYSSRDNEYNVEIYRNIMHKFDVSAYASYEERKLDLENAFTSGSRTYGASFYWPITKKYYMSMFLEFLDKENYSSSSVFAQLGYKFKP